ncbi:CsbD family protein [uncultured Xylophilus sp.]|uniref:CsbD family protein n=1 Tax=uncultured Xylophilus sp. TaxID=296832 RepID=UPI0025F82D9B|nr:CsbD family protein [uncultured Xylophilus sp.]
MLEKIEGTAQKLAGHVQDAFGAATGDNSLRAEGKTRQAAGKAQELYGDALNQVRESAVANPLATLAIVAGAGFLLGALFTKR